MNKPIESEADLRAIAEAVVAEMKANGELPELGALLRLPPDLDIEYILARAATAQDPAISVRGREELATDGRNVPDGRKDALREESDGIFPENADAASK